LLRWKKIWPLSDLKDKEYYSLNSYYIASATETGLANNL
jgi:hypothetical protein